VLGMGWPEDFEGHLQIGRTPPLSSNKAATAGRCTLTPPDPQLKGAWYPGGFNP
jgi:hypothetical protein